MTETSTVAPRRLGGAAARRRSLLDVRDLRTYFQVMDGTVPAVDGVSFSLRPRQDAGHRRRVGLAARA